LCIVESTIIYGFTSVHNSRYNNIDIYLEFLSHLHVNVIDGQVDIRFSNPDENIAIYASEVGYDYCIYGNHVKLVQQNKTTPINFKDQLIKNLVLDASRQRPKHSGEGEHSSDNAKDMGGGGGIDDRGLAGGGSETPNKCQCCCSGCCGH
jgi:hypothetical protein